MPPTEPLTSERIALALDPEKEKFKWIAYRQCPKCSGDVFSCSCVVDVKVKDLPMVWHCDPPDFLHDDLAAFVHLRPVLHALGCRIEIYIDHVYVEYIATGSAWGAPIFCDAICLAISYFLQHAPDALAQAVREVRG